MHGRRIALRVCGAALSSEIPLRSRPRRCRLSASASRQEKPASPKPLAPPPRLKEQTTKRNWQRALGSRRGEWQRGAPRNCRSVHVRAGLWGSKELFSISVSTENADQATSASSGVCDLLTDAACGAGLKLLEYGRLRGGSARRAGPRKGLARLRPSDQPRKLDSVGKGSNSSGLYASSRELDLLILPSIQAFFGRRLARCLAAWEFCGGCVAKLGCLLNIFWSRKLFRK